MKIDDQFVYFTHAESAPFEPKMKGDEYFGADHRWQAYLSDFDSPTSKWFRRDTPRAGRQYPDGYHFRRPLTLLTDEQRALVYGPGEFSPF